MSTRDDSARVRSLGKGHNLHQQGILKIKCHKDLTENPLFCKLLATLSQHVDRPTLTVTLKRELRGTCRQRLNGLCSESLFRLLQEMIQEHCVRKHHSTVPPEDDTEQYRTLDPSATTSQDQPPVLGLSVQLVLELENEGLKNMKLSHLSGLLERERAESLKEKSRECRPELLGCIQILQSLILDHRLKAQK
uniref:Uncharacterized protein n=1 Tax=Hucho hucho TaxID=62062 RepID=A0A4W5L079_9TELE